MSIYGIQLEFDVESEPPKVYIADEEGSCYIEVLEEPYLVGEGWSWEDRDWIAGEMAMKLLNFMNSKDFGS